MKFVQVESSIHCLRTYHQNGKEMEEFVVDFDARLDRVAPHVAGLLTTEEIEMLEAWLSERALLQEELEDKPLGVTVLETLPVLLDNATRALGGLNTIDEELFKRIKKSLIRLDLKLSCFHRLSEEELTEFSFMEDEDVLKEQLDSIKKKV